MVRVLCPHCGRRYRTEITAFGTTAICTQCHETFRIGEKRPPFDWKEDTPLAEDSWIGIAPPEDKPEAKHCMYCQAPLAEDVLVCLSCGRHQVTGIIHKAPSPAAASADEEKLPWHAWVPWRWVTIAAIVLVLIGGGWWVIRSMTESVVGLGDELAEQVLLGRATRYLQDHDDPTAFADEFRGRVTDSNLPAVMSVMNHRDPLVRKAAVQLIGCSDLTDFGPLLAAADDPSTSHQALEALDAYGIERLLAATNSNDARRRQSAADAVIRLCSLPNDAEILAALTEPATLPDKIDALNQWYGRWPQATGRFVMLIGDVASPFVIAIEQIGPVFVIRVVQTTFRTPAVGESRIVVPIGAWCVATGAAQSATALRESLAGQLELAWNRQTGWQGHVTVRARRPWNGPLPGFLPLVLSTTNDAADGTVRLERPGR